MLRLDSTSPATESLSPSTRPAASPPDSSLHPPRHQHPIPTPLPLQPHRPKIQRLVMHGAQRQAIGNHVPAIVGMPPDVRGLQSEQAVAGADVVLAHGAAFVVCLRQPVE